MLTKDFPGYEDVLLTHDQLKRIITTNNMSWKAALSNVKGIYLQLDKATGKQYVGSAYGSDMLWGRLSSYAHTYYGGNKDLRKLFDEKGAQYFTDNFSYTLLETFKSSVDDSIIIRREHRWMEVLGTKKHGYNN